MELQNRRFHILAGIRRPLVLSVGSELLRVSRRWRSNSSAFDFRAHVIHVFRVHWKTRSRIMETEYPVCPKHKISMVPHAFDTRDASLLQVTLQAFLSPKLTCSIVYFDVTLKGYYPLLPS